MKSFMNVELVHLSDGSREVRTTVYDSKSGIEKSFVNIFQIGRPIERLKRARKFISNEKSYASARGMQFSASSNGIKLAVH